MRTWCDDRTVADEARTWSLEELHDHRDARGRPYDEVLRVEALSVGVYRLAAGATDPQSPHCEDEIYVVLSGRGSVQIGEDRAEVSAGSVVYVPRGLTHRFSDITDDLEVLVVFVPPESF